MDMISFWLIFYPGMFLFLSYSSHYLLSIISLEIMMLSLFYMFAVMNLSLSGLQFTLLFMVLMVCMGGYSITMMVKTSRFLGNESSFIY